MRRMADSEGSILLGAFWMIVLSLLLFWLPGLGALIAGIVGGKVAGGVTRGIVAALLPAILAGAAVFLFAATLFGLPLFGFLAGAGVFVLVAVQVGPLLIGAIIGGLLA